jgi:hypothetical protein
MKQTCALTAGMVAMSLGLSAPAALARDCCSPGEWYVADYGYRP